jgi:hypothetical protein
LRISLCPIMHHFRPRRHLLPAPVYRQEVSERMHPWQEVTSVAIALFNLPPWDSWARTPENYPDRRQVNKASQS